MRIAICDDDKEYRELLANYVNFYFNNNHISYVCDEYVCGEDLLSSQKRYDIVFLDIEMKEINGLKVTEVLNQNNRNSVVFIVTSYNNYLDDAMDLKVFRFIDKNQITPSRIYISLGKAIEQINHGDILIHTADNNIVRVLKNDIMYIEVNRRETTVVTVSTTYKTREPISYFKEGLKADYFVIPHNSFIVNLNFVNKYQRDKFTMKDGAEIDISQKKQPLIRKIFFTFASEE